MIDNARKYVLNVNDVMSHGISACTSLNTYNLLNSFSFTSGGTTCSFSKINVDDLGTLPNLEYNKRVEYFLNYVDVQENTSKIELLNESSYYNSAYDITCELNEDFLVYKFLSGVRVVNVGKASGVLEYLAYPIEDNPENYSWQTNGTFLELDLLETYVFKIRDNLNGDILCEYEKEISLPQLLASTTETLAPISVSLEETYTSKYETTCFSSGKFNATPTLSSGQRVSLDYVINTDSFGGGDSQVTIFCKNSSDTQFKNHSIVTNSDYTPLTRSIEMNSTTQWCYLVAANSPIHGANSSASLSLNSVNGLNTTVPSISDSNKIISLSNTCEAIDVVTSIYQINRVDVGEGNYYTVGNVSFNPAIPSGNSITLNMETTTTAIDTSNSSVQIYCRPYGSSSATIMVSQTSNGDSKTPEIIARYGDTITYRLSVSATTAGSSSSAGIAINSTSDTYGVNSSVSNDNYGDSISAFTEIPEAVVGLCQQESYDTTSYKCNSGYISFEPMLEGNQSVSIGVCGIATKINTNQACVVIECKGVGTNSFVEKVRFNAVSPGSENSTGSFTMNAGDLICYTVEARSGTYGETEATLSLCSVSNPVEVNPSINTSKNEESVVTINNFKQVNLELSTPTNNDEIRTKITGLVVSPSLSEGESFELNFENSIYASADTISHLDIISYACLSDTVANIDYGKISETLYYGEDGEFVDSTTGSIIVTSENINSLEFSNVVVLEDDDLLANNYVCSNSKIMSIVSQDDNNYTVGRNETSVSKIGSEPILIGLSGDTFVSADGVYNVLVGGFTITPELKTGQSVEVNFKNLVEVFSEDSIHKTINANIESTLDGVRILNPTLVSLLNGSNGTRSNVAEGSVTINKENVNLVRFTLKGGVDDDNMDDNVFARATSEILTLNNPTNGNYQIDSNGFVSVAKIGIPPTTTTTTTSAYFDITVDLTWGGRLLASDGFSGNVGLYLEGSETPSYTQTISSTYAKEETIVFETIVNGDYNVCFVNVRARVDGSTVLKSESWNYYGDGTTYYTNSASVNQSNKHIEYEIEPAEGGEMI